MKEIVITSNFLDMAFRFDKFYNQKAEMTIHFESSNTTYFSQVTNRYMWNIQYFDRNEIHG